MACLLQSHTTRNKLFFAKGVPVFDDNRSRKTFWISWFMIA